MTSLLFVVRCAFGVGHNEGVNLLFSELAFAFHGFIGNLFNTFGVGGGIRRGRSTTKQNMAGTHDDSESRYWTV